MLISNKHKFAFVHIPKTGGTSVKAALLPYANPGQLHFDEEKVTDLGGYKPHIVLRPRHHLDKLKFAVVRNPWSWYVSYWKFAHKRKLQPAASQDFIDFIRSLGKSTCKFNKLQSAWIHKGQKTLTDKLLRFENLEHDFKELCQELQLPQIKLGHYKNAGDYDYRDFYTEETKLIVEKHCKQDIQLFNFKF